MPTQKSALEVLVGHTLSADEVTQINVLLPLRNDVAIAALLSVNRKALATRTIDERGVRALLPVVQAAPFLGLLKSVATADTIPDWLSGVLAKMGVDVANHAAYFDTMACAHPWLQQEAGIDLGAKTTRDMLDLIAASDFSTYGQSVSTLKSQGQRDDPIHYTAVSDALNVAENRDMP